MNPSCYSPLGRPTGLLAHDFISSKRYMDIEVHKYASFLTLRTYSVVEGTDMQTDKKIQHGKGDTTSTNKVTVLPG